MSAWAEATNRAQARARLPRQVVTEDHLTLLTSGVYIRWDSCEFGAPYIDPKRPYGNGDVFDDMAELLPHLADDRMALARLHGDLLLVLDIVLSTRSFRPGVYVRKSVYGSGGWTYEGEVS